MEKLTVGKMAEINNFSPQALRMYDKMGLLKPSVIGEENGYRYYDIRQSACLDMIQYMKSLGMSLKDIKEVLDLQDMKVVEQILNRKLEDIEEELKQLVITKTAILRALDSLQRYKFAPKEGAVVLEYIQERLIYRYESDRDFYASGVEAFEYMMRSFKNHILLHDLPLVYFCNVGSIVRKECLLAKRFRSNEIFLFVDEHFEEKLKPERLPAGTYLCIYCESFRKERQYCNRLMDEIEACGYQIAGDYICEVVAEFPVFSPNERNTFIKLQVPVKTG